MNNVIATIVARYHPGNNTFTVTTTRELLDVFGQTQDELDAIWDEIENELTQQNLWMQPALPDADPNEEIRIYRRDAPLTRVILEALTPSQDGDQQIMLPAILALNSEAQKPQPPRATNGQHPRNNGKRPNGHGHPRMNRHHTKFDGHRNGQETDSARHLTRPLE